MSDVVKFIILGLGTGGMYAIAALGLVLVYRGSHVVNFGHGAIGMVGTYLYWELSQNYGWPFVPSLFAGLVCCALLGAAIHMLLMRPLRNAARVVRVIATLGVLTTLQAAAALRYPQEVLAVRSTLPQNPWRVLGATVGADRVWLFLIALALTAVLVGVYRYSSFGLKTAAVAENERAAVLLGHSADRIAMTNWAIGSALAGLAGILLAPIIGLQVAALTLLVIPALAAAVVGRLTSFGITFTAGVAVGVLQSLAARYVRSPGWPEALPFLLMIGALILQGSRVPPLDVSALRLPRVGSGRVDMRMVVPAVGVTTLLILQFDAKWADSATTTFAAAIIVLSLVVVTGFAGQLSLAQFALAGLGGWVAARVLVDYQLPFLLALGVGMIAALPIGILFGLPAVRTRGTNLAIATLGLSVAVSALIFNSTPLTGGAAGLAVGTPRLFGIDLNPVLYPERYALFCLACMTLLMLAVANIRRGRTGRRLIAARANERAASSLGVNPVTAKLYAFGVSSMIAAVGGGLMAFRSPSAVFDRFTPQESVFIVAMAVIGGIGTVVGPLIGAMLFPGSFGTRLGALMGPGVEKYLPMLGGLLLIVHLIAAPNGVVYLIGWQLRAVGRLLASLIGGAFRALGRMMFGEIGGQRKDHSAAATLVRQQVEQRGTVPPKSLRVDHLRVRFGGVVAVDDASIVVESGRVVGLIGPNGAGKSTLFDAVAGFVRPAAGSIRLDGQDLRRRAPHQRARLGLGRSFQHLELFEDMTVLENLLVAVEPSNAAAAYVTDVVWPRKPLVTPGMLVAIEEFDLWEILDRQPTELSYGYRRLVAVARAVAGEPSVLMLDEPSAGLDATDRAELSRLIRRLAEQRGMAVLLVEHDVELVMACCDTVIALDFGRVIASGTPAQVRSDPKVIRAYLGELEPDAGDGDLVEPKPTLEDSVVGEELR